jgi:predicted HTH transcriptional regulator
MMAMDFVRKHSMRKFEIKGIKHNERWNLPLTAIREAIINAVVHVELCPKRRTNSFCHF